MNRSLVRTDHVLRYNLFVDTEASRFDGFRVELLDQFMFVTAATFDDAWREALDVVTWMRGEYSKAPCYHPSIFSPWASIVAVETARESAKHGVRINMIVGGATGGSSESGHPLHEERVRCLITALDQIDFLKRPKAQAH